MAADRNPATPRRRLEVPPDLADAIMAALAVASAAALVVARIAGVL